MTRTADLAAAQAAHWNSPLTRGWATEHARIDAMLAAVTDVLLGSAAVRPGEQVIDVGCGSGTTVLALAERVGAGGHVLGVDIAAGSIAQAQARIARAGLAQVAVAMGDAATHAFAPAQADLVVSRFGVMFFADPVAAFANLRGAVRPGGRFVAAAWRTPQENPWATAPVDAVRDLLPPLPVTGPEEPGQFAWADAARVHRILEDAGWREVALVPHDVPIRMAGAGGAAAAAAELAFVLGPVSRACADMPPAERAVVRVRLEAFFGTHATAEGVHLPGAIWIVTARTPDAVA